MPLPVLLVPDGVFPALTEILGAYMYPKPMPDLTEDEVCFLTERGFFGGGVVSVSRLEGLDGTSSSESAYLAEEAMGITTSLEWADRFEPDVRCPLGSLT